MLDTIVRRREGLATGIIVAAISTCAVSGHRRWPGQNKSRAGSPLQTLAEALAANEAKIMPS